MASRTVQTTCPHCCGHQQNRHPLSRLSEDWGVDPKFIHILFDDLIPRRREIKQLANRIDDLAMRAIRLKYQIPEAPPVQNESGTEPFSPAIASAHQKKMESLQRLESRQKEVAEVTGRQEAAARSFQTALDRRNDLKSRGRKDSRLNHRMRCLEQEKTRMQSELQKAQKLLDAAQQEYDQCDRRFLVLQENRHPQQPRERAQFLEQYEALQQEQTTDMQKMRQLEQEFSILSQAFVQKYVPLERQEEVLDILTRYRDLRES